MERLACAYCGEPAALVTGREVYPHRHDLHGKPFWHCASCFAWVGCHPGTNKPLGRLANGRLRKLKMDAHAAFDPLWKRKMVRDNCSRHEARTAAYQWLAGRLGIHIDDCHIGMFDEATCVRVAAICTSDLWDDAV